jgi:hypothetical protein
VLALVVVDNIPVAYCLVLLGACAIPRPSGPCVPCNPRVCIRGVPRTSRIVRGSRTGVLVPRLVVPRLT